MLGDFYAEDDLEKTMVGYTTDDLHSMQANYFAWRGEHRQPWPRSAVADVIKKLLCDGVVYNTTDPDHFNLIV